MAKKSVDMISKGISGLNHFRYICNSCNRTNLAYVDETVKFCSHCGKPIDKFIKGYEHY